MKKLPARIVQHQQRQLHLPLTTLRNSHPSPTTTSHRALIRPLHCLACVRASVRARLIHSDVFLDFCLSGSTLEGLAEHEQLHLVVD